MTAPRFRTSSKRARALPAGSGIGATIGAASDSIPVWPVTGVAVGVLPDALRERRA